MSALRIVSFAAAVAVGVSAFAISGPAPLAWRWLGKTSYAPKAKPILDNGVLYASIGRRVYALDARSGNQKWLYPVSDEASGDFSASPCLAGDVLIAPNTNNFVYAINKTTGQTAWSFNLGSTTARHVVADDKTIYVFTADDRIMALEPSNGAKAWSTDYSVPSNVVGEPVLMDGHLVFFLSSGKLIGVNVTTKREAWSLSVQSSNPDGGPTPFGQSLYVVSGSQVAQVNPRTGRTGFVASFPEKLAAGVAVTEKGGAAITDGGNLYLFSLAGRVTSKNPIKLGGYAAGSPQAAGDCILVRLRNGSLILVDPARNSGSGDVVWEYTCTPVPGTTRRTASGGSGNTGGAPGGGRLGGGGGMTAGAGDQGTTTTTIDYVALLAPLAISTTSLYGVAEDGSVFAWGGELGVDEVGPTISMLNPPMGNVMWGQPDTDFWFKLEDQQTGVMSKSITVTMNGEPMKFEYKQGPGDLFARIRQPGSREPGANPPLSDGKKTIVVSVSDWAGNITERTFFVKIDNTLYERPRTSGSGNTGSGPGPTGGRGGGGRGGGIGNR